MHIQSLYIKDFKNIKEQTFDLSTHNGLTLLIGNNGCGKSNLLESISYIFFKLYQNEKDFSIDFALKYKMFDNSDVDIKFQDNELVENIQSYPKRVIAIYSGEEQRMWSKYYSPIYSSYIKSINRQAQDGTLPQMLYLSKLMWNIALLSLLCSEAEDNQSFVREFLGITEVNKIEFTIQHDNDAEYKGSPILNLVGKLAKASHYTLDEFKQIVDYIDINTIFIYLYIASAFYKKNSLLKNIVITFNGGLTIKDLSEGQKKLMLVKAALEFAGAENTLYLLDEPDAHIHIGNKIKLLDIIQQYTNNRHVILTTHSPSMAASVDIKHILSLGIDSQGYMV